jgi:hypothetical protein
VDLLLVGLLLGNLYLIVYYRLMIHASRPGAGPAGLALVLSMPSRRDLGAAGLRYWRRYWLAVLALVLLSAAGLWWRHPHLAAQLRLAG